MNQAFTEKSQPWAIVVADDHGSDWAPIGDRRSNPSPVQYRGLGSPITLLQKALHRAGRIAPTSQLLVTARDDYRDQWDPAFWFLKPTHRFVGDDRSYSWLTTAAALLRIAAESPQSVVVILPARCFVAHEQILSRALDTALQISSQTPEGVLTLGMLDIDAGIYEDYLVPDRGPPQLAQPLLGVARQPAPWIARHLRAAGALVASEIIVARVCVLTAHISRLMPGLTAELLRLNEVAESGQAEVRLGANVLQGVSGTALRSFRWYPPSLPQRALRVNHCGWSSLRSAQAVARVSSSLPVELDALSLQAPLCCPEARTAP